MSEIEFIICVLLAILIVSAIGLLILTCKVRDLESRIEFAIKLNCEDNRLIDTIVGEINQIKRDIRNTSDCEDNGRVEAAKQMGFLK